MVDTFKIKDIIDEDYINYYKPSMFIATNTCNFKCEFEDELNLVKCQNSSIINQPTYTENIQKLINRYMNNILTHAIVFGGLEPLDQLEELLSFIDKFRNVSQDDIVIYTGYTEDEVKNIKYLDMNIFEYLLSKNKLKNIIIKYGRFKIESEGRFDEVLGITLASKNQYAKQYNEYNLNNN